MNDNELQLDSVDLTEETPAETVAAPEETPTAEVTEQETPAAEENAQDVPAEESSQEASSEEDAPAVEETAPTGLRGFTKKLGKKGAIIGGAAVALITVIAIVLALAASTPLDLVTVGFHNSIAAFDGDDSATLLDAVANGGSTEITIDLGALTQGAGEAAFGGLASLKYYTDAENNKMALAANVDLGAGQALDLTLFIDENDIVVCSDSLLGEAAYGAKLEELVERSQRPAIEDLPENFDEDTAQYNKAAEEMATKLAMELFASFKENAAFEEKGTTLAFSGKNTPVTAVSISLDHLQISAILSDLLDFARTDASFREFVTATVERELSMIPAGEFGIGTIDADTYVKQIFSVLDNAAENMDDLTSALEESNVAFSVTFYITKSGKQLVGMDLNTGADDQHISMSLCAGPDLKEPDEIRLYMEDADTSYYATYTVQTNDDNAFASQLMVGSGDAVFVQGTVDWNKITGDLAITVTDEQNVTYAITGSVQLTDEKATITLDHVDVGGAKTELNATIVLSASDETPSAPAYTDLMQMSEDDLYALLDELGPIAEGFIAIE